MAIEKVKAYLSKFGIESRIIELKESSATVELAAAALNCEPARIAKTISLHLKDRVIVVVTAGDTKIDNKKFRDTFGEKPTMLAFEEVEPLVGHAVGGVCPFALNKNVEVYLDVSMKRFETVFPAAGSSNSAIELTLEELEEYSQYKEWVDVCKGWDGFIN